MLRITIELWPRGNSTDAKVIAQEFIANDGRASEDGIGNYDAHFSHDGQQPIACRIEGHDRRGSGWKLLHECSADPLPQGSQGRERARFSPKLSLTETFEVKFA